MADNLILFFFLDRFVDDIRSVVDAFCAELQRSAACERKARVISVPVLGEYRGVMFPGFTAVSSFFSFGGHEHHR